MPRQLENLRIWSDARIFVVSIYEMMRGCQDYGFRDQIQRAAVSIMNNIAEGSGYGSDQQFVRYLRIANGSCSEVRSMLYLCYDLHFCNKTQQEQLLEQLYGISSGIHKMIEYLEKKQ